MQDRYLRVRTEERRAPATDSLDAHIHLPVPYPQLRRLLRELDLRSDDVLVDVGCGLGRVVCVAARRDVERIVGIEIDPEMAALARRNASRVRGRRSTVEILIGDAAHCDVRGGTAFVLFNPFGEDTLRAVVDNWHRDLECQPRSIRVAYVNPTCEHVFEQAGWLRKSSEFTSPRFRATVSLWSSTSTTTALGQPGLSP
jgi:SAM-dependent methyltransferase